MLRDIRSGHVQAVVVWDIDRLTRTPREIEDVIDLSEQRGVALAVVGGKDDIGTSDGRLLLRIKASIARREVEQMSRRLKRKYQEKAANGELSYAPRASRQRAAGAGTPPPSGGCSRASTRRLLSPSL